MNDCDYGCWLCDQAEIVDDWARALQRTLAASDLPCGAVGHRWYFESDDTTFDAKHDWRCERCDATRTASLTDIVLHTRIIPSIRDQVYANSKLLAKLKGEE